MLKTAILAAAAVMTIAAAPARAEDKIKVMVLGTYHMNNPGRDVNNMKADDVRTPKRQRELEQLAVALAEFKPTKIMIETQTKGPDFTVAEYRSFTPAMLTESRDERVQIGYRLARKLGHGAVYGIDEKPGEGEPDYFPYGKLVAFADSHGRKGELMAFNKPVQEYLKSFETRQATESIPTLLAEAHEPGFKLGQIGSFYYQSLSFGDGESQPGAELNGGWYLRNAKIFSKLINVARPGDRVLVIFGGGHAYWLRHFAKETPGFELVEALPYLKKAAAAARR